MPFFTFVNQTPTTMPELTGLTLTNCRFGDAGKTVTQGGGMPDCMIDLEAIDETQELTARFTIRFTVVRPVDQGGTIRATVTARVNQEPGNPVGLMIKSDNDALTLTADNATDSCSLTVSVT